MMMAASPAAVAVVVRLAVLAWAVGAGGVGTPYDGSGGVAWAGVPARLAALANWDGVYNGHLALRGYSNEKLHAFYPGYPAVVAAGGRVVCAAWRAVATVEVADEATCTLAAAVVINVVAGAVAAAAAASIVPALLDGRHPGLAGLVGGLAAVPPAGVFYTAVYTEAAYAAASLVGLAALAGSLRRGPARWWRPADVVLAAVVALTCAAAIRSNGALHAAHLGVAAAVFAARRQVLPAVVAATGAACVCLPTALLQWYGAAQYCSVPQPPSPSSSAWCPPHPTPARLVDWLLPPPHYAHVQSTYWGVGFMTYWTPSQLPNWLLAAPMLVVVAYGVALFTCDGLSAARRSALAAQTAFLLSPVSPSAPPCTHLPAVEQLVTHPLAVVCHVHLTVLAAVACLFGHVQVITRLASPTPSLLILVAHALTVPPWRRRAAAAWLTYVAAYTTFGTALFVRFYPWT